MTAERVQESKKRIFALMRSDDPGIPVLVESGGPASMAIFAQATEADQELNWYGVVNETATFVPLSYKIEETTPGVYIHTWTYMESLMEPEASAGDVFAEWHFKTGEAAKTEDIKLSYSFAELNDMSIQQLRHIAHAHKMHFTRGTRRLQLAMLLNAPTFPDPECPSCRAPLLHLHGDTCEIALCQQTGKPANSSHVHAHDAETVYCGMSRWLGYEPGVLESFVYNVSPERIVAEGVWDKNERVFIYGEQQDIDETEVVDQPRTDTELSSAVNDLLSSLGKKAKENAAKDYATQNVMDELGVSKDGK